MTIAFEFDFAAKATKTRSVKEQSVYYEDVPTQNGQRPQTQNGEKQNQFNLRSIPKYIMHRRPIKEIMHFMAKRAFFIVFRITLRQNLQNHDDGNEGGYERMNHWNSKQNHSADFITNP